MHYSFFIFISFLFFSCNSSNESGSLTVDSSVSRTGDSTQKISAPIEDKLGGKSVSFWLQSPEISAGAKFILSNTGDVNLNTKDSLWNICDSLLHAKNGKRAVYFYAVTKTLKMADGAYSEIAGAACKKLMEDSVMEFVHCFSRESMIKISDLELWSHAVFLEICLENEGKEKDGVMSLYNKMKFYESSMNAGEKTYSDMFLGYIMNEEAKFHAPKN